MKPWRIGGEIIFAPNADNELDLIERARMVSRPLILNIWREMPVVH
jgi:hypothetical protein